MIQYRIQPLRPEAHLFVVEIMVAEPMPEGQAFAMPAWIPGSYMIRDFARHVVSFRASAAGAPVSWVKLDKQTWQLDPVKGPVVVRIEVYAWDLSVRGAHLDLQHGYFNGSCVFLAAKGYEDQPCEMTLIPPEHPDCSGWQVATGMPRVNGPALGFGTFIAENYDALIDYPVEMGRFEHATFEACGVPHQVVISGRHRTDMARLCRDLKPICEEHIRMFGEPAPVDDYVFMTLVTGNGYGGLEHRNSTSLMCARNDLPRRTDAPDSLRDGYRTYLGLCSHEYFHTWNIKRIKPDAFTPFDLSQEVYTELLWAFEGITSYYDDLALVRAGVITPQAYLELVGQTLTRVQRGSGASKQTVTESSFDAWTRFYKQDENAPNAIVSYYAKGALIALALDLTLREITGEKKSLDDLMRLLWRRYGQRGLGLPEQGIRMLAEEIAQQSMADFFDLALYSTDPLPLAELLARRGVQLQWRSPAGHADTGGKPAKQAPVYLGVRLIEDPLGARIQIAHDQGAAMAAGLSAGDVIVALDGLKTDVRRFDEQLAAYQPGEKLRIHAFRGDELLHYDVLLSAGESDTAVLTFEGEKPNEAARQWLRYPG
ncbi:MAG: PDZ domain-containing protein [Alcanivorax sp.]|nr:PDZ domain-containing protein [Alcanivorax sp.]